MNNDLASINYKKPIGDKIINIRGTQVMLDSDVATKMSVIHLEHH